MIFTSEDVDMWVMLGFSMTLYMRGAGCVVRVGSMCVYIVINCGRNCFHRTRRGKWWHLHLEKKMVGVQLA